MVSSNVKTQQIGLVAVCMLTLGGLVKTPLVCAQSAEGARVSTPAAAPKMRSRLLTSLTGYEVADYLKRNNVIFVPVGPTEVNGGSPTDVEYVIPLAYALKLAEKGDGLVLPYVAYTYPGSTTISPGTVMVTPEEGLSYLRTITHSLIRQGFRRIVYLTSHGPSGDTMRPLVREIFDETHVSVVWMDAGGVAAAGNQSQSGAPARMPGPPAMATPQGAPASGAGMQEMFAERKFITFGAYQLVGRLEDIPINFSVPVHQFEGDTSTSKLSRLLGGPIQSDYGRFYADPSEHGGWPTAITAEQRAEWGRKGSAMIESQVAAYDVVGMLEALGQHDAFTKTLEKKYGPLLPPGSLQP